MEGNGLRDSSIIVCSLNDWGRAAMTSQSLHLEGRGRVEPLVHLTVFSIEFDVNFDFERLAAGLRELKLFQYGFAVLEGIQYRL